MLKIENVVLPSAEQMYAVIRGARNPMNSWERMDSNYEGYIDMFYLGENDKALLSKLANAGTDHRKFMRMMNVYVDVTAPLYWWKEFDTYKVGTVANGCSTMHKIHFKEFTLEDFSYENLIGDETEDEYMWKSDSEGYIFYEPKSVLECWVIPTLEICRKKFLETKDKKYWNSMIQLLPSSYNQKRTVMLNYETLRNVYHARKNHKLDEWHTFCDWIETLPYFEELIKGE